MESLKRQVRGIITRDCIAKAIGLQHTNVGCERAEYLVEQGESARFAVKEGIAIAEGLQRLSKYRRRSTLLEVA